MEERLIRRGLTTEVDGRQAVKYHFLTIDHPSFENITREKAYSKLTEEYATGEPIFRPSSKGPNHLNASFKIDDTPLPIIMDQLIAQDPSMKDKKNPLGLSEKLMIDQEEFEDLDEIIARYISPLMGNVEDLKRHKYYWIWVGLDFLRFL